MQHLASSSWSMLAGVSSPGGGVPTLPENMQDTTHHDGQSQPQEAKSPMMTPAAEASQPKANAAGSGGALQVDSCTD